MCTTIEQQPCKRVLMPTIGRDGSRCKQRSIPHGPEGPAHAKACTDGWQSANEQRSSAHFAAVRQRSASGVAAARSHGRICPDAGRRTVPRGPEGPVHARAPTVCAALAWPACRPVSPHGWPMMDGCNTRLPAHGGMPERSSSTKRAVRTSLSMQSVHEQLVQRETGPGWTAAARVPPLQQPAPASGRAC